MPGHSLPRLAIAGLLALAACADDTSPPPVSGGRIGSSTASAARQGSSGPVTTFDGSYQGSSTLNPDRSRRCPEGIERIEATVRQGRASLIINPSTRQTLSGIVREDGSVRMIDIVDRLINTSGIFNATSFTGTHRAGICSYAISLQKIM